MARFHRGGCLSYVYLAAGRTGVAADDVVMYEPPGNHEWKFVNVLFGDGRAETLTVDEPAAGPRPAGTTRNNSSTIPGNRGGRRV